MLHGAVVWFSMKKTKLPLLRVFAVVHDHSVKRTSKNQMWDILRTMLPFIGRLNNNATVHAHTHAQGEAPPALTAKHPSKINCKLFT